MEQQLQTQSHTYALSHFSAFLAQVYGWMTGGLLLTALVAFIINTNISLLIWLYYNEWVIPVVFIAELILVVALAAFATKMHPLLAAAMFVVYALMNGVFFGIVVSGYTGASVFTAFAAAAGTFLLMSFYGWFTGSDLTSWGNLSLMALVGLILGSILNIFLASDGLSWFLTYLGIGIFIILIAYDTQKIKRMAENGYSGGLSSLAIVGALELYLDFINLFIRLLSIFGRRR